MKLDSARAGAKSNLASLGVGDQTCHMTMPLRFVDDDYTPRLWAELYPILRNMTTGDLAKKMLSYKNKPVEEWRPDDCGLLDAVDKMLALRAGSREHALPNESPPVRDAAFWAKLDKELEFSYEAEYPGKNWLTMKCLTSRLSYFLLSERSKDYT